MKVTYENLALYIEFNTGCADKKEIESAFEKGVFTLHIKEDKKLGIPEIILDASGDTYYIHGQGRPDDPQILFFPIMLFIKQFPKSRMQLTIQLDNYSGPFDKQMHECFLLLNKQHLAGKVVEVIWIYREYNEGMFDVGKYDEDMFDAGEEYAQMVKFPFTVQST